jgi:SpoVK/Ycf46/Vps4 family AAA+-type ATPase
MHVPRRFAERVALHLAMNASDPGGMPIPLMLGVHGRPGEGKTAMTRHVLREMGVLAMPVFADAFESENAGEPPKELRQRYVRAAEMNARIANGEEGEHRLVVLVIDDLDQRIAGSPEIALQQTQNTPLLNAALMELADSPKLVDGVATARTPILITANHLDWIYGPAVRTGRMAAFRWEPRLHERVEIVSSIFPELSQQQLSKLMEEFPDRPISDFGAARHLLHEMTVGEVLAGVGLPSVLDTVRDPRWQGEMNATPVSLEAVLDALGRLAEDRITT